MKKAEAKTLKPGDRVMLGGVGTNNAATVLSVYDDGKKVLVKYDTVTNSRVGPTDTFVVSSTRIERFKK